jgi:hypothetical protein
MWGLPPPDPRSLSSDLNWIYWNPPPRTKFLGTPLHPEYVMGTPLHPEYVILIALLLQQCWHDRPSMLRNMHIVCFVSFNGNVILCLWNFCSYSALFPYSIIYEGMWSASWMTIYRRNTEVLGEKSVPVSLSVPPIPSGILPPNPSVEGRKPSPELRNVSRAR